MNRISFLGLALTTLLACDEPAPSAPPTPETPATATPSATATTKPSTPRRPPRKLRGSGPELLIHKALRDLDLDEEQKKALHGALSRNKKDIGDDAARSELNQVLASGVRAGKLDTAAVKLKAERVDAAMAAKSNQMATLLNALHATLTPAQRRTFAASMDDGSAWMGDDEMPPENGRTRRLGPVRGGSKAGLAQLLRGLALTTDQRKMVKDALAKDQRSPTPEEREALLAKIKEQHNALKDAFASDDFDAVKLGAAGEMTSRRAKDLEHEIDVIATLTGMLDATQREKLATNLEGASKRGRRGRGLRGSSPESSPPAKPGSTVAPTSSAAPTKVGPE